MSIKDIAKHAEASFQALCAAYPATCNKADQDERGWDFFVQFPRNSPKTSLDLPTDMQPGAHNCLIQIKSSRRDNAGIRLKLSNAQAFSKDHMPCFIVLFPYEMGAQPNSVYLLHFWEKEIADTLRKSRELDAKGEQELHRATISFRRADMVCVKASELLATIHSIIDKEGASYFKNKHALAEQVGFADRNFTGKISLNGSMRDVVDMMIGLTDRLPATSISMHSIRFGMQSGTPLLDNVPGKVSLRSLAQKCLLQISSESHGVEVSLHADLFLPSIPDLPRDQIRYRVCHPFLEMIGSHGKGIANFHATLNYDQQANLASIATMIDIARVFSAPRQHFQLSVNGKRWFGGTASIEPYPLSPGMETVGVFVDCLRARSKLHDIPDGLRMSLNELIDKSASVREFNTVVTTSPVGGYLKLDRPLNITVASGKAILTPCIELSNYTIYGIVKRDLKIQPVESDRIAYELGAIDYVRIRIFEGSIAMTEDSVVKEVEASQQGADNELLVVFPRKPAERI